jgi:hypothetical protein
MEMKGFPDNVVSIGEGILGGRLPCTLEVHAVVEDIVAEVEILVPDGIGPEGAVHVVICVSTGNSCVCDQDQGVERGELEPTLWDRELRWLRGQRMLMNDDGR